ncbi:hypothetical protein Tco_0768761 [Tanacetum coccineum]
MASSSRLLNTNCFQYDKCDNGCILKCDDRGRCVWSWSLTNFKSEMSSKPRGFYHWFQIWPRASLWNVVEDDKALYLLRGMTAMHKEFMDEISKLELKEYDKKERMRLAEPPSGSTYVVTMPYHVSYKLQNPQAIRIIMGIAGRTTEGQKTDDPFQGYAMEIFLPDRLYNIQDAMTDKTESLWKIIIPKKKGEWTQTIGGNLLFFQETQICKPTLWRPT